MIDQDFKAASDAILEGRMAQFRHLTSIVGRNARRGELQWYLNKRNRSRVRIAQETRELVLPPQNVEGLKTRYQEWVDLQLEHNPYQLPLAVKLGNPDLLTDEDMVWYTDPNQSEVKAHMLRTVKEAKEVLSTKELQVFVLLKRGKGSSAIAEMLNVKQGTISKLIQRIQDKLRKIYDEKEDD